MREAALFTASQERVPAGFLSSLSERVARFYRTWKVRRRIVRMTDLDDHILDDIGVTRTDLFDVLNQPFSNDPSLELQRIAKRNRSRWVRG